ncbi:MAG: ribonuclease J [Hyphomicrobiales bacterium]|nr:ribonuclease J [Hyphomicrobiales bacterium]
MAQNSQRTGARRSAADLVFLPLGGAGEIGMNLYLYGHGPERNREWLMVDCGVKFGDEADPGIDVIVPEISFIDQRRISLQGIVLTHAHEDHMGAIPWLWEQLQVPVYCTPFAAELLRRKLAEAGLLDVVKIEIVALGDQVAIGGFEVEFVSVTHSIPEPASLVIRTAAGTIVHSGDWKLDRTPAIEPQIDMVRFREIGDEGVDVLVCDSTNILREGHSPSERDVADTLAAIIDGAEGRVAVTTFASHVGRISSVVRAARAVGREVVVAGRAMRNTIEAAREVGLMKDLGTFIDEEAYGFLPRNKTLLLCTGSQGESRAALARIAGDNHSAISLDERDLVVFSSKTIPGNEKAVAAVVNALALQGVEVLTSDDALIHSSGHPRQDELAIMYEWLRPRALVPMHGEAVHLKRHAEFAKSKGIDETVMALNGDLVQLNPGPVEIIGEVIAGRTHVDGRILVPSHDGPARERRRLSFAGIVCVSALLDAKGKVLQPPQLEVEGIPETDDAPIHHELQLAAIGALEDMTGAQRRNDTTVIDTLRSAVRRAAAISWGKKPRCKVIVHRI